MDSHKETPSNIKFIPFLLSGPPLGFILRYLSTPAFTSPSLHLSPFSPVPSHPTHCQIWDKTFQRIKYHKSSSRALELHRSWQTLRTTLPPLTSCPPSTLSPPRSSQPGPQGHQYIHFASKRLECTLCRYILCAMNRKGKRAPTTRYGCRGPGCGFSLCPDCYNIRHKDIHVSYYYRSSSFSSLFGIWLFFLSFFHFVFSLVVFSALST